MSRLHSTKYDSLIEAAVEAEWPECGDWRMFKAQVFQESMFDPNAQSSAGAMGLAQIMPSTWAQLQQQRGLGNDPFDPEQSLMGGAYYMHHMWKGWTWERPYADRWALSLASYNAGRGNLLRAQRKAHGAALYASIIAALPQITGRHARETTEYVRRIFHYYTALVIADGPKED